MPELPEVETTRLGILPHIINSSLRRWEIRTPKLRWPVQLPVELKNQVVRDVRRRAKYLVIHLETGALILHLGMSGSLSIVRLGSNAGKHDHIDLEFENSNVLRFNDPRKFGSLHYQSYPIESHWLLKNLGPEPLSPAFTGEYLFERRRKRKLAIKNLIMDGKVVVGVGNIYASEALFRAGIRPNRAAGQISLKRCVALAEAIRSTLVEAIQAGGTTLRDFTNSDGKPGYFGQQLNVYGRNGEACYRCKTPIKLVITGQRSSFYCPKCQK
jgi:formamidopyrimidine-DNA glycosylase